MNNYKIIWSPKAYDDLQNIYAYIAYHFKEKHIANSIVKKILNSISSLNYLPERHIKIYKSNSKSSYFRKLTIGQYIIVYEVGHDSGEISILHIFHDSQNYLNLL